MSTTKLSLDILIELQTLDSDSVPMKLGTVLWDVDQPSCVMIGTIEPDQWPRIWDDGLFHLDPEAVVHDVTEFEEEGLITLELALDKAAVWSLMAQADPIEALLKGLVGDSDMSATLRDSASWRACTVMQEVTVPSDPDATLQIGFQTVWTEGKSVF
ncbi:MAG: hypothetical protein ACR2RB_05710 [Gammaproteobacteria bacterium]